MLIRLSGSILFWAGIVVAGCAGDEGGKVETPAGGKETTTVTVEHGSEREEAAAEDVRRGDVIAVRYRSGQQFRHVGVLAGDGNGILDGRDVVIHARPRPLRYSYLSEGNFNGEVVILRP